MLHKTINILKEKLEDILFKNQDIFNNNNTNILETLADMIENQSHHE